MDLDTTYNTDIQIDEEFIQKNVSPERGYLVAATETQHKGDVASGNFRDVIVRLTTPRRFSYKAIDQLRKYPRYHARRFNLWWLFKLDPDYRDHLRSLSYRECRALDEKFLKQQSG